MVESQGSFELQGSSLCCPAESKKCKSVVKLVESTI